MSDLQSGWQDSRQAMLETSALDLAGQIAAAEEAVFLRMEVYQFKRTGRAPDDRRRYTSFVSS